VERKFCKKRTDAGEGKEGRGRTSTLLSVLRYKVEKNKGGKGLPAGKRRFAFTIIKKEEMRIRFCQRRDLL